MTKTFNPPPHWPEPPREGWAPPAGWTPDRSWGAVPAGWRLWADEARTRADAAPLAESEDIPASGARVRPRIEQYPVTVVNPGMWSDNQLEDEDYGFPPAADRPARPRLRLAVTIVVTVLGLLVAVATALLFVRLVHLAHEDLPAQSLAPASSVSGPPGTTTEGAAVSAAPA